MISRGTLLTGGVDRSIEKMDSSLLLLVSKQRPLCTPSQILRYALRSIHLLLAPTQVLSSAECETSGFPSQLSSAFLRRQGGDAFNSNHTGPLPQPPFHCSEQTLLANPVSRPPAVSGFFARVHRGCSLQPSRRLVLRLACHFSL